MSLARSINLAALERHEQPRARGLLVAKPEAQSLAVQPSLRPRDEAIFWLTAAAEIEHALMVQYLFAGYSINPTIAQNTADQRAINSLKQRLLQIAREEMGHLITVQNLLQVLGGPPNFRREHSPYASEIYPFRFKLDPLALDSLAKYVVAEMPDRPLDEIDVTPARKILLRDEIVPLSTRSNDGHVVKHVGPIFRRLSALFGGALEDSDFRLDRGATQAQWTDWGFEAPPGTATTRVLVIPVTGKDAAAVRALAKQAVETIGEQGEAADVGDDHVESHFDRFLKIYEDLKIIEAKVGHSVAWPVVRNPNTTIAYRGTVGMLDALLEGYLDEGRIVNARTRCWAQLFNFRYRLLMGYLAHTLSMPTDLYECTGAGAGDRTPKGWLHYWAFCEMRRIKKIAEKLVQMPASDDPGSKRAGPPFELPYTLDIPDREVDRWSRHADVLSAARSLVSELIKFAADTDDPFLRHLLEADDRTHLIASQMANGQGLPSDALPSKFIKAAAILDESVRGFDIGAHRAFWRNKTRDQFVVSDEPGVRVIVPGDVANSPLLERISEPDGSTDRMPRHRPRIPQLRIDFIRSWIASNAPDSTPPGTVGIPQEPSPKDEPKPAIVKLQALAAAQTPLFAQDIKPLFRKVDRSSMKAWFDLHDYNAVKTNANHILTRLEDGTMPCTGAWPQADIDKFKAWISAGYPP